MTPTDLLVATEVATLKALAAAGRRARLPRSQADRMRGVPEHAVHTRIRIAAHPEQCERLLAGAWGALRIALTGRMPDGDITVVIDVCDGYARELIVAGRPLNRGELSDRVQAARHQDAHI
ncbi:hypothetical protein OG579_17035 [Williamsia herbipolensis]|uniref:Uncharacterized protein n=1 Tax=Williamsia herbipolensis TaxID=1603258 RepID=A0AAU4K082_9NOCA|nr:hypothetical protein [Williamsia herbipolensis]